MIDELDRARRRDSHDGYASIIRLALRRDVNRRAYRQDLLRGFAYALLIGAVMCAAAWLGEHAMGFVVDLPPGVVPGR